MSKRFLVMGSNSFSGSHFAAYLVSLGHTVLAVSRSSLPCKEFLPHYWHYKDELKFEFKKINLNQNQDLLENVVEEFRPTHVVNFAAQGMVAESWVSPIDWYQTNLIAQVKFHDILRKSSHLEKYVHVTTPEVYGSTEGWIKENYEFFPSTPYAASRAACDLHLLTYFNGHDFPVIFTRAANVYGPGQQLYRIIPKCILSSISGKKFQLHGGGKSIRSFIHIDDVVNATLKISMEGAVGETYHISTNELISIKKLTSQIASNFNLTLSDIADLGDERLGKDYAYKLSSEKLRGQLGWSDEIKLQDGIDQTINWVQANYDALQNLSWNYEHKI